jgi:hypothetical protein
MESLKAEVASTQKILERQTTNHRGEQQQEQHDSEHTTL